MTPTKPDPDAVADRRRELRRETIRDFHLTGARPGQTAEAPLEPLALHSLAPAVDAYPLHLRAGSSQPLQPVRELLAGAFEEPDAALAARAAARELNAYGAESAPLLDALRAGFAALVAEKGLDDEAAAQFEASAQRALAAVRNPGLALGLAPETPALMLAASLTAARLPRRNALLARMADLADHLDGMLLAESGERKEGALSRALGADAGRFIDAGLLAQSVAKTSGHRPLGEERRERVEQALQTLRRFLARAKKLPLAYVLTSDDAIAKLHFGGVEFVPEEDPCFAAVSRFDQLMREWESGLRAAHLAELEIEGVYDPDRHARSLARLDWQAAAAVEIEAAPAIAVVETAERVARSSLTSLGRLLRSGRPLQALVLLDVEQTLASGDGSGDGVVDLPYLAMAHREALVVAETLAEPSRTAAVLERVSRTTRPALAVIAAPSRGADHDGGLAALRAFQLARVTPSLIFDPDEGEGWAERFSLRNNDQVESLWVAAETAAQQPAPRVTPADAAALLPTRRADFWMLPSDAWSDEMVELVDYLDSYDDLPPATVPYIQVSGGPDGPARAVVTRELANLCREIARAWRTYQELAGVHNRFVEQAVDRTRQTVGAEQDELRERLVEASRREGAASAVYRLVEALSRPNGLAAARASVTASVTALDTGSAGASAGAAASASPSTSPAPTPAIAPSSAPAPDAPASAEPSLPAETTGPYIESALCTSCNECINLNPQMFKYNAEKQAYVADPKAGTYKQLLKAAAACPAKCIFPGPPPA